MELFISQSGERSKKIAEILNDWIPIVIQAVNPWISPDIGKGVRWSPEIAGKLSESKIGIFCLTPENLHADWILFEAGAISKNKDSNVCTFLFELTPADIEQPLAQFQHTTTVKDDIKKLIFTINNEIEHPLPEKVLTSSFEKNWPDLELSLKNIPPRKEKGKKTERPDREILEEILELNRRMSEELIHRKEIEQLKEIESLQRRKSLMERHRSSSAIIRPLLDRYPILEDYYREYRHLIREEGLDKKKAQEIIEQHMHNLPSSAVPKDIQDIFIMTLLT